MSLATLTADSPIRTMAAELQRQLETKRDLLADTRRVSFAASDSDWLNGEGPTEPVKPGLALLIDMPTGTEAFNVTRHAGGQIAEHIGVPWKLYDRLHGTHPDLFRHLVNGLLAKEPSTRMIRTMDGKARAFLSDRYRPRDNWDLLEGAILPTLDEYTGRLEFKQCSLTDTRMYVKVVLPDIEKPITPKVGDAIRGGLIISNSEVGAGALYVYPYTDYLVCLNGMVHTEFGKRRLHVGKRHEGEGDDAWELYSDATLKLDDEAYFAKVGDTIRGALNATVFDRIVAQMQDLAGIKVDHDPVAAVEVLATRHGFTEGERGTILQRLIEGADTTAWGYVNAITRTARDLEDIDRQVELETLAGRMTSDPEWAKALAA